MSTGLRALFKPKSQIDLSLKFQHLGDKNQGFVKYLALSEKRLPEDFEKPFYCETKNNSESNNWAFNWRSILWH